MDHPFSVDKVDLWTECLKYHGDDIDLCLSVVTLLEESEIDIMLMGFPVALVNSKPLVAKPLFVESKEQIVDRLREYSKKYGTIYLRSVVKDDNGLFVRFAIVE